MSHPVVSVRTYVTIFGALMLLTVLTVAVAFVDMGFFNTVVAVTIAVAKAFLVVAIFMHLKYSARVLWLGAGAAAVWFIVLVSLTLSDVHSRNWLTQPEPWTEPAAASTPATPGH